MGTIQAVEKAKPEVVNPQASCDSAEYNSAGGRTVFSADEIVSSMGPVPCQVFSNYFLITFQLFQPILQAFAQKTRDKIHEKKNGPQRTTKQRRIRFIDRIACTKQWVIC